MSKWYLGVEKGTEDCEGMWQRKDLCQSDLRNNKEAAALRAVSTRAASAGITSAATILEELNIKVVERLTRVAPTWG